MYVSFVAIRSAAVTWQEYQEYLACPDEIGMVKAALAIPVVEASLQEFSPFAYDHIRRVANGGISPDSKKGRKALRHLAMTMARAATRSTPSRLLGRIGAVNSVFLSEGGGTEVLLEQDWRVRTVDTKGGLSFEEDPMIRWNPSAILAGRRSYLTVPRNKENQPYSSVERNDLIDFIACSTKSGITFNTLVSLVSDKYKLSDQSVAAAAIKTLIEKEFLLDEKATTFSSRFDACSFRDLSAGEKTSSELSDWLQIADIDSVESSRNASIKIRKSDCIEIQRAYEFMLRKGLCESMDQGMANELASMIHERYGYSKVQLSELIRPGIGLTYNGVLEAVRSKHASEYKQNLTAIAAKNTEWVDLADLENELVDELQVWRTPKSFSVPISIVWNESGETRFMCCDGVPGLPADVLNARFISVLSDQKPSSNGPQDGIDDCIDRNDQTAGFDWTSAMDSADMIRESSFQRERKLNVNAFKSGENEVTINDLWVWSDGDHTYVEDPEGNALWFQPQSMVSMAMYPDWVSLLLVAGTDSWPTMSFNWESLEKFYNRLPGVRYGNVVYSRPRYRYSGAANLDDFNNWCEEKGISRYIRIGKMDRKVLIDRTSRVFSPAIQHLLRSGDSWIEDAQCESGGPVAKLSQTNQAVHCELVYEGKFPESLHRPNQPKNPGVASNAIELPAYYLIPGVSEVANLVLVPRSGKTTALLTAVELTIPGYEYFVRYYTKQGFPCLRLRVRRSYLGEWATRSALSALLFDGWATDISDEVHRLEVERYGGVKAFEAFNELFKIESHWIGRLAVNNELDQLELEQKALLVWRWLTILREVIGIDLHQIVNARHHHGADPCLSLWKTTLPKAVDTGFPTEDIASAMKAIATELGENSAPWPVAAHLWCNRLGIAVEDEIRVWSGITNLIRRKEGESK